MKKRIQYMYENGDDTFLDALVESEDISDLLNRVEYVSEVYSYDRELFSGLSGDRTAGGGFRVTVRAGISGYGGAETKL